jgi:heat shock protein HslJ
MTDESPAGAGDSPPGDPDNFPDAPPEKMGLAFYAALALIGCLVLMVLVLNYPAVRANAGMVMTQTNWTLQSYTDAAGIAIPVITGSIVSAQFSPDGSVTGSAGCNRYAATYQTHDYSINISGTSSTKMHCQEPGIMNQESAFLADLSEASSFRVSQSSLKFYDNAGKTMLVFVPV